MLTFCFGFLASFPSLSHFLGFIPHGHCYFWNPSLIWLHALSDGLIALAYYSIPLTLLYFVRKRPDLPYTSILLLFGAFIVSCGTTHLLGIWTLWHPSYWLSGFAKAATAFISLYTALALIPLVPQAMALRSSQELEKANQDLQQEIAERLRVEEALQQSEQSYRAIVEDQIELIVRCDRAGTLTFINSACCSYFGRDSEDLIGTDSKLFFCPQEREKLARHLNTLTPESPAKRGEYRMEIKDERRWVQWNYRGLYDEDGVLLEFQCVGRDVSDRVAAEQSRRQSEERFHSAFHHAAIGKALVSPEGRCLQVNPALCQIVGYSEAELLAMTIEDLTHPDDLEADLSQAERLLTGEIETYQIEKRYLHKQGRIVWASLSVSLVRNEQDDPLYFISQIQDISDRIAAETALRKQEKDFRLAFKDAAVGMALVSPQGNWLQVNPAICKLVGYSETELLEKTFQEITHPDDLNSDLNYVQQMLAGEIETYQMEKRYFHKQGHIVWILLSVSLVRNEQDEPLYFISQIQDISDRKQTEAKIEASLQEKEVLLKEVHHRVKNNLQVICSLINLQCRSLKDSATITLFRESQNRVKSMSLIHEKLYQSQNLSSIQLNEYVRDLTNNLCRSYTTQKGNITLKTEFEGDFFLDIDTAVPFGLIINELISNAFKYAFESRDRGEILIRAEPDKEKNLILTIRDNGKGLSPNFNLKNAKSLGLRLVKNLTHQLRGTIEIENHDGSQFKIVLTRIKLNKAS